MLGENDHSLLLVLQLLLLRSRLVYQPFTLPISF
jgi:hypothetical protein